MDESIGLAFRPATLADAGLLLAWRNDPVTRGQSLQTAELRYADHLAWLAASLADPSRELQIVERCGQPIGTIRIDRIDGVSELSWAVAPAMRGRGFGTQIVRTILGRIEGAVQAKIKIGNTASRLIAERAGMRLAGEEKGVLLYVAFGASDATRRDDQ